MIDTVLKFVSCCRAADLRISTAEVLDCVSQLERVDLLDEFQFRTVLRANLVKDRREQKNFDRLYHLFFHEFKAAETLLDPEAEASHHPPVTDLALEALGRENDPDPDPDYQAVLDFLGGDPAGLLAALQDIQTREETQGQALKSNLGALSGRLKLMMQMNRAQGRIRRLLAENPLSIDPAVLQTAGNRLEARLNRAYALLAENQDAHADTVKETHSHASSYKGIGDRFFSSLTPQEIDEMRGVVDTFVKKLKDLSARRYAAGQRRVLDPKGTLKSAARYQGVPMEVKFRFKPPRKGKIVTLCDISGSVWSAARFMLNLLYALQDCFSQVRSFVFINRAVEVTRWLQEHEANTAIEMVMTDADIAYEAPTDYGATFEHFQAKFSDSLNKKTSLIVIGDGRSNYYNPREDILDALREKCRRLIWLNPEPPALWHTGDSEMKSYKPYCNEVRPCQNLNQLIDFIQELVL